MACEPVDFDLEAEDTCFLSDEEKVRVLRTRNKRIHQEIMHAIGLLTDLDPGPRIYGVELLERLYSFKTSTTAHKAMISYAMTDNGMANVIMGNGYSWGQACIACCLEIMEKDDLKENSDSWTIFEDMKEVARERILSGYKPLYMVVEENEGSDMEVDGMEIDDEDEDEEEEEDNDGSDCEEETDSEEGDGLEINEESDDEVSEIGDQDTSDEENEEFEDGARFVMNPEQFNKWLMLALLYLYHPDIDEVINQCIVRSMANQDITAKIRKITSQEWTSFVIAIDDAFLAPAAEVRDLSPEGSYGFHAHISEVDNPSESSGSGLSTIEEEDESVEVIWDGPRTPENRTIADNSHELQGYIDSVRSERVASRGKHSLPMLTTTVELRPKRIKLVHSSPGTPTKASRATPADVVSDRPFIERLSDLHLGHAFNYADPVSTNGQSSTQGQSSTNNSSTTAQVPTIDFTNDELSDSETIR